MDVVTSAVKLAPLSVQVVDYDEKQGKDIQQTLQNLGFVCEYTQQAPDLLNRLSSNEISAHWGCMLLDVRLPYYSGVELQNLLHQHDATLPIVFMGNDRDIHVAIKVFKAGAFDFLLKPLDEQLTLEVINQALRERQKNLHEQKFLNKMHKLIQNLSARENQVLHKLLDGLSNKNIATALEISAKTVEQHRANIMKKMQAESFATLVSTVVKYNLVKQ
jgi:two-component system response regulator FixJ